MSNLTERDELKKIVEEVVKENLPKIVNEELVKKEKRYEDISLIERIVKVEQSLENINKLLEDFMHAIDRRFEQVDKRFEQVYKRFEQVDNRFEQINKRFEDLLHYMDKRFEDLNKRIGFMSWFIPTIITIIVVVLRFV